MSSIKIVLLIVVMSIASFTYAQTKDPGKNGPSKDGQHMEGRMHQMKLIAEKLHLTDQQKDKIKSLQTEHMKKMIDLKADLKKAMVDLRGIRSKADFTRKDVLDQVDKLNKIKDEMAISKANHLMDIYELLTPEQQKIAKDNPMWFMQDKHKGMMNRNHH